MKRPSNKVIWRVKVFEVPAAIQEVRKTMRKIYFLLALLMLVTSGEAFAQGATGTVLGTITDSSGAVLPNVRITVTNTATNVSVHAETSSAGDYSIPSLNPGSYSVTAESPGFEKSKTNSFVVQVDQKVRIDLSMKPGAVNVTTEVTAQGVALDTDSTSLSQEMSGEQVADLPLNGRNFMQLLLVGAGAVTVGGEQGTMRQGVGNAVSINGGRPEGNNYTLDGLINTDPALVTPAVVLSQDAIGEFKVESGTYPAEYGFSASQINLVSKAGTNQIHGSAFWDNRNDAYDAKPFVTSTPYYQTGAPTTLGVLRQNQFGYVASGPVYIPKLYNGRDKSFWMANYEGWRINNGGVAQWTLPNPATLTGDFSAETYQAFTTGGVSYPGGPLPAYGTDTCTALLSVSKNCAPLDPTTGQSYGNNKVPINARLAQMAIQYNYFATPNLLTNAPEGVQNFQEKIAQPLTSNQQTYRGDQTLGRLGSVFGRYTYAKYQNSSQNQSTLGYGLLTQYETQKSWAISHTISLGNSKVNNFRFGYLDAQAPQGAPAPPDAAVSLLGETGTFTKFGPLQQSWPSLGLSQFSTTGGPGNAYTGSDSPGWEYADSFTMVKGRHTIGLGVDYRRWQLIRNLDDDFYGDWSFGSSTIQNNSNTYTDPNNPKGAPIQSCPNAPVTITVGGKQQTQSLCGTGNAIADLELGYYSGVGGYVPAPLSPTDIAGNPQTHIFSYFAPYAEDNIKVTNKLKLNVGLRWDFRAAAYEKQNHFFWLDTQNANGGLCYADPQLTTNGVAPGGVDGNPVLRYCGSVPHPGPKTPFAPRFGFNYEISNKMLVRGGYGIFYDSSEGREIDDSADIYPYAVRNSLSPTGDATLSKFSNDQFKAYNTLQPFPLSTLSFIAVIESENPLNPYIQSYTLSVERELGRNTTFEVNYIGTKGTHFLDRRNIAQALPLTGANLSLCQTAYADNDQTTLNAAPCTSSSRRPYPNFTSYYIDSDWHGYSNYNAMNVKFEHRAHDLAVTGVFTWARSMDDKSAAAGVGATGSGYQGFMNNADPGLDYGPSDFNVDHRFVASYIYQLPFGRGKRFGGQVNRALDEAIGGWQISGITTFQTGFPFSYTANDIDGLNTTNFQRANFIPGCDVKKGLTQKFQFINPDCFTAPAVGVYGNSARNFLRQPGINNWDMAFAKSFAITERAAFKLNIGTFNTFNHHQYAGDVGGLATGGSGGNNVIDSYVGDAYAGYITGANSARIIQLSGKLTF
jgi:Carboxypeptidase regulatory-like domain